MKSIVFASLVLGACHSSSQPVGMYDLAGAGPDLSATEDDGGTHHDAGVSHVDAETIACDPSIALDGGDPAGSWTYVGGCATSDAFFEIVGLCSQIVIDSIDVTGQHGASAPSGVLTLQVGGAYSRALTEHLSAHAIIPQVCWQTQMNCGLYASEVQKQFPTITISCNASCSCTLDADVTINESGSWTGENGGITLLPNTSASEHLYANTDDTSTPKKLETRGDDNTPRGTRSVTQIFYGD